MDYLILMPPFIVICVALITKRIILALIIGIILSYLNLRGNFVINLINDLYLILSKSYTLYILGFSLLVGSLLALMASGALEAFAHMLIIKYYHY